MDKDFLEVVDFSRKDYFMVGSLNSTFITLIPKKDPPESFSNFRPIALYNPVYNMGTKVIVDSLKPKVSKTISKEQSGFLGNRKILYAIGPTQECIHSVKTKNISSIVMKLDLAKAYDKVNWDFLRLVLLQIGLPEQVMGWIMACVSIANF